VPGAGFSRIYRIRYILGTISYGSEAVSYQNEDEPISQSGKIIAIEECNCDRNEVSST
jgi:hypothetical protein